MHAGCLQPLLLCNVAACALPQALLLGIVYAVDRAWFKKGLLPPW